MNKLTKLPKLAQHCRRKIAHNMYHGIAYFSDRGKFDYANRVLWRDHSVHVQKKPCAETTDYRQAWLLMCHEDDYNDELFAAIKDIGGSELRQLHDGSFPTW